MRRAGLGLFLGPGREHSREKSSVFFSHFQKLFFIDEFCIEFDLYSILHQRAYCLENK